MALFVIATSISRQSLADGSWGLTGSHSGKAYRLNNDIHQGFPLGGLIGRTRVHFKTKIGAAWIARGVTRESEHSNQGVLAPRSGRILRYDQFALRPDKALQLPSAGSGFIAALPDLATSRRAAAINHLSNQEPRDRSTARDRPAQINMAILESNTNASQLDSLMAAFVLD